MKHGKDLHTIITNRDFKKMARPELLLLRSRILFEVKRWIREKNDEAKAWLFIESDRNNPRSFEFCCFWLGVDPIRARKQIEKIRRKKNKKKYLLLMRTLVQ